MPVSSSRAAPLFIRRQKMQDKRRPQAVRDVPLDGMVNTYGPLTTALEERRRRLGWHEVVLILAVSVVFVWLALSSTADRGNSGAQVANPARNNVVASANR